MIIVAATTSACLGANSSSFRLKLNQAQIRSIDAGEGSLFAAVVANADEQSWVVEEANRAEGRVIVVTPSETAENLITRERWTFTVTDNQVSAQMVLEAAEGGDPTTVLDWESYEVVCAGYSYTNERTQLTRIAERAQSSLARNP